MCIMYCLSAKHWWNKVQYVSCCGQSCWVNNMLKDCWDLYTINKQYVSTFLINTCNYDYAFVCFTTNSYIVYALLRVSNYMEKEKRKGRKIIYIPSLAFLTLHRNVFCTPFRSLNKWCNFYLTKGSLQKTKPLFCDKCQTSSDLPPLVWQKPPTFFHLKNTFWGV